MVPAGTRFVFEVMPKDGSEHRSLYVDLDWLMLPRRDDAVDVVTDKWSTTVIQTTINPTGDPAVFVKLRSFFPATSSEAEELLRDAKAEGWKEFG